MKIGEVKVGEIYGALDHPTGTRFRYGQLPRKVEVLEVVEREEWRNSGGTWGSRRQVKVKRLKVKVLDGRATERSGWGYEISAAKKDAEIVVEARQIVAPWEGKLATKVQGKIDYEEAAENLRAATESRLTALLGKKPERRDAHVGVEKSWKGQSRQDIPQASLRINGAELETLLRFAELGKGVDVA